MKFAAAFAMGAAMLIAAPAHACVRSVFTETLGKPLSKRAQARYDAQVARRVRAERVARFTAVVRTGRADIATEIADMLIPNVRAVVIDRSSCGEASEYDMLGEIDRATSNEDVFDGTEFEGLDPLANGRLFRADFARDPWACNTEVRGHFAALLRKRLAPAKLDAAYVNLAVEREQFHTEGLFQMPNHFRFYRFTGPLRAPPVVRDGGPDDVLAPGRPIAKIVAKFWANEPIGGDMIMCPVEARDFLARREARLAVVRTWPDYPKLVREAGQRRAARGQPALKETGK